MLAAQHTTVTFVLKTASYPGYWSRGANLAEAAKNLKRAGAKGTDGVILRLVYNDLEPWLDEYGAVHCGGPNAPEAWTTLVGVTGTLAGLIKANPVKK